MVALLTTPLAAQSVRRAIQWEHVTVAYNADDETAARVALDAARDSLPTLEGALGLALDPHASRPPIRMDIARRQADFDALVGQKTKPWVQGMSLGGQRRIVLKALSPTIMKTVVAHELTHVLLDAAAAEIGADPPRWLHEGLAKLSSGDFTPSDRELLGQAAVEGRLLTLDQLDPAFAGDRATVSLAYAQSYTLVRFLHELHPGGGVQQFLLHLSRTNDVSLALARTYGQPQSVLEKQWLQQTETTYLKQGIPLTVELAIFGAMAVLALIGFVVQGRRRRIIRERLQEEELLRGMFGPAAVNEASTSIPPDEDNL